VAHFPDEGADADALFRLADERLYESKRTSAA
jgi:GGDEF domain-containing protein